jgi:AmmeMemoRadiSam system protein A
MTNEADRQRLLHLARDAVVAAVSGTPAPLPGSADAIALRAGVFVTLHLGGRLRGCIGQIEANEPVAGVVARCAVAAATTDPRFPAVEPSELAGIDIELSIIGPLEPVGSLDEIEVGRHGLLIETGRHRGLLLPQVATERSWDRAAFVAATCHKAGLAADAWEKGAKIWRFEAEVFGERAAGSSSP